MADLITADYLEGASLPDLWVTWRSADRALIPFATEAYTFTLKVAKEATPDTAIFTKSSGFTGFDADPNLTIQWALTGEISDLTPGIYVGEIKGVRVSDSRDRKMPLRLVIRDSF